jgi:transposase-like protein
MNLHVFLLLFLFLFMLSLAPLCHLSWPHHGPPHSRAAAKIRTTVQRLLKPRSPLDCPACCLASTLSSGVEPAPLPVRPWREIKSRRGAPKRVNTEGFACPNRKCLYSGITDAHIHALVGDGTHGHAERIQTFRCQACRTTFSARRHTPLYRLKTPSHQIGMVLSARASGLDPSAAARVFGYRQATISSLSDSRSPCTHRPCTSARISQSPAPAPPAGRTAHQAALLHTRMVAVAGHRPPHEDHSRPPPWSPHPKCGAHVHPLPAAPLGRLSASHFSPVMV